MFFPNKGRLIASVKMRRGEGGYDLYESALDEDGRWSKLKSLGKRVNTWGDEVTPFVAADGVTVFASNGLQSMGGFDVYRTTRNAAGGWTEPEHLGAPINSVDDDMAFVIGAKGEVGYLASRRNVERGDLQLFEVSMNGAPSLEQEVVILTLDAENLDNDVQPELLIVKDANTGDVIQRVERENTADVFNLILPTGRDYVVESAQASPTQDASQSVAPAVRRTLTLSEDLEPEVIELTFEEVFQDVEEADELKGEMAQEVANVAPYVVQAPKVEQPTEVVADQTVADANTTEGEDVSGASTIEDASAQAEERVSTSEQPSEEVPSGSTNKPAEGSATPAKEVTATGDGDVMKVSAPLAPMALAAVDAGQTIMAVQLYSGQVHTERMDMTPALVHCGPKRQGKQWCALKAAPLMAPLPGRGQLGTCLLTGHGRLLRLVNGLTSRGLEKGVITTSSWFAGSSPMEYISVICRNDAHPASFQYVRMDVAVR